MIWRKKCNIVLLSLNMQNIQVFAKNMLMISKKVHAQKQWQNMQKNAISSSAVPRTLRLLTSNMYVNGHIFFTAHIYIYIYIYLCMYNAVFWGYHPVKSTFHYRGKYRGKIPDGHSNPIYLVLKPLKLQNSWRIFDRPVSSMYCKHAEYACKLQTNLSMNNKQYHDMEEKMQHRIVKFKYA